jgi:hypothetical protein
MGRKRKSLEELALTGTLKANPGRYKRRIAADSALSAPGDPLGDPPVRLPQGAKTAWAEISSTRPWLTAADRLDVELAATLTANMRNTKKESTRADLALLQRTLASIDKKEKKRPTAIPQPIALPQELIPKMSKAQYLELEGDLNDASHVELFFDNLTDEAREDFLRRHPDFDRDDEVSHEAVASRIAAQLKLYDRTKLR